jgi:hypothetical protein
VVHEDDSTVLTLEILHVAAVVDISFEIFDVIFDVFGFVSDGEIEDITAKAEAESINTVTESDCALKTGICLPHEVVLTQSIEGECSWGLNRRTATLGRLMMP